MPTGLYPKQMTSESAVIERAARAYYIAKLRNQRTEILERDLSAEFPKHYRKLAESGHYIYEGETADQVIEASLERLGYKRGSNEWARIVRMAILRGEEL